MDSRQKHIVDINRQSAFKQINIIDKNQLLDSQEALITPLIDKDNKPADKTRQSEIVSIFKRDRSFGNSLYFTGNQGLHTPKGSIVSGAGPKDTLDKTEPGFSGYSAGGFNGATKLRPPGFTASTISNSRDSPFISTHHQLLEQELGKTLKVDIPVNNTNIEHIIRRRLEGIHVEMDDFINVVREFAYTVDNELENLNNNMATLQKNLNKVHLGKNGPIQSKSSIVNVAMTWGHKFSEKYNIV